MRGFDDCFIIAELGTSFYDFVTIHNAINAKEAATTMIFAAQACGANAVKFQVYKADRLTSNPKDIEYFSKYDLLDYDDYIELIDFANSVGIEPIATLFDEEAVEVLGPKLKMFKIASPDITYKQLIQKIAKFWKPIFLSTGASKQIDIHRAINWIHEVGQSPIRLMHCVASYPTKKEDVNLSLIKELFSFNSSFYDIQVGYSDHSIFDLETLKTAYLLGARFIEKHFTLDKGIDGNDHFHSMDEDDLKSLVKSIKDLKVLFGDVNICHKDLQCEKPVRTYGRRSIHAKEDIEKGEVMSEDRITYLRPGTGIPPYMSFDILGRKTLTKIKKGSIINHSMLKK